jgi:hypothetical protein
MYVAILAQLSKHEVRHVLPRYSGGFVRISAEKDLVLTRSTLVSDPGWEHDPQYTQPTARTEYPPSSGETEPRRAALEPEGSPRRLSQSAKNMEVIDKENRGA